jgi:hypothetical protein
MRKSFWIASLLLLLPAMLAHADSQWILTQSSLTYTVTHPLHVIHGASHAARGKGVCQSGQCDFLIAVPVKTFDSGDSNRDLHMIQVTRGAQFPMVTVRLHLPESQLNAPVLHCDMEIQFAGQMAAYKQVSFTQTIQGKQRHIVGTIPATVSDFKIDPPSFFTVPIRNEIPIQVDANWQQQ